MKKEGFTLVELLAVIAILAILVIIALPNILSMFNNAKKSSFETELKSVYTAAEEQWINDTFSSSGTKIYAHCLSGTCSNELKLNGRDNLEYYIEFDNKGNIVKYYAKDGSYQYSYNGPGLKKDGISGAELISTISDEADIVSITCTGASSGRLIKILTEGKTVDTLSMGDEIRIKDEHFNVVGINGNQVILLAKYNLKVGNKYENNVLTHTFSESDEGYGIQSADCVPSSGIRMCVTRFSSTMYWSGPYSPEYPVIYSDRSYLYYYVEYYKNYLNSLGLVVDEARLLTHLDLTTYLGCSSSMHSYCSSVPFLKNTNFYLGNASSYNDIMLVTTAARISYNNIANEFYGTRPVIVISKSEFSK